jgi:hypothetical protein
MRITVLIASLLVPLAPVWACSCSPIFEPPCQAAWTATAVFTGTVIDIAEPVPAQPETGGLKLNRAPAKRSSGRPLPSLKRVVRMQIREVLTGVDAGQREIEIVTGRGGGDCGYSFQSGVDYVIYAYKNSEGRLETGICSRTRPLAQAAEDIVYLRAVAQLPATADIRVFVVDNSKPQAGRTPRQGVRTTISGPDGLREALTDNAGRATFTGLQPGEYTVQWASDGFRSGNRKVQIHAKGCAEVPVTMVVDH